MADSLQRLVQFSLVAQSCPTLCDPMDCSMPGFPVHDQLPELAQTHVHWVGDAIQPSHPLLSPSPPTFNPSQHQGLFLISQFSLSSFTFIKRLFSSSLLSAIRVVPSAIWGYWYFSWKSWFQLVLHPAQHFSSCIRHIS